ncbi:MAG: DUF3800 domain-containing protein [Candidatus Saccharimonadales bacterium]
MSTQSIVFMDESGNKESDRYFVCGFLLIDDVESFNKKLSRVRDQIEAKSRYNKQEKIQESFNQNDLTSLYNFAKSSTNKGFELKFKHISNENISQFKILVGILFADIHFRFDAICIDRNDPNYRHDTLKDMYKIVTHKYFNYRCKSECIFIPDIFDVHNWNWGEVLNNDNINTILPAESHSMLALQVVDVLTGLVGLGLKTEIEQNNSDKRRLPLLESLQKAGHFKISREFTVRKPRYFSVWTLDFSKTKKRGL